MYSYAIIHTAKVSWLNLSRCDKANTFQYKRVLVESNNKLAALTETIEEKTSKEIQLRRDIGMLLHCLFLHNVFFLLS